MLSQLDLESKCQGHSKNQKTMPRGSINMLSTNKMRRDSPNYWCPTDAKYVINDLLAITERGQQRSRVIRCILITAQRFLASSNQISKLIILELSDLGHRIGSFSTTVYAKVRSTEGHEGQQ